MRWAARRRGIEVDQAAAAAGSTLLEDAAPRPEPAVARALTVGSNLTGYLPVEPLLTCSGIERATARPDPLRRRLAVAPGEIVALLGTNGAGKSTLLKVASGLLTPTAGRVRLDGHDIAGPGTDNLPADAVARRGLSLMAGGRGVFPTLTVDENLRLAAWMQRDDPAAIELAKADVLGLFPVLAERHAQAAGSLSGGEQQMLALAGSLMTRPKVLLIDELSLGLAPTVVSELFEVVREVHQRGTTIVVVEQSVNVSLELAQRAVFMEKGEVRFEGPAAELLDRPDLLRSVFITGTNGAAKKPARKRAAATPKRAEADALAVPAEPVLRVASLTKRYGGITAVDEVDLHLGDGEILGLIGHNGAGKTTLLDCISGFLEIDAGAIDVKGIDVTGLLPEDRARAGLGRSFQEAMLYPTLTVAEAVAVSRERHLQSRGVLADGLALPASYERELDIDEHVDEVLQLLGLGQFREALTGELSTGTRRVVELGCLLAQDPDVLLLDEPSSGVAQKETEALGDLLRRVRAQAGCSMLVIEHDMPLLSSLCDRMVALELGAVIADGPPAEVLAHPQVIASYLGSDPTAIQRSGRRRGRSPRRAVEIS